MADLREQLLKCSAMMRGANKQLWAATDPTSLAHRRGCTDPDHYGCNALQAVEAMEAVAALEAHPPEAPVTSSMECWSCGSTDVRGCRGAAHTHLCGECGHRFNWRPINAGGAAHATTPEPEER